MEEVELEDLVVEDASSLERLLLHELDYGPSVRITGATRLKMLGYLGTGFPIILLGDSIFKVRSMRIFPASSYIKKVQKREISLM
jgi:hypothetical protein